MNKKNLAHNLKRVLEAKNLKEAQYTYDLKWAKLEDGSVELLYYGEGMIYPQNFYYDYDEECWYLDHDVLFNGGVAYCHSKIVEFATERELL